MVLLGISTPSLILGQSKFAAGTGKAGAMNALKYELIRTGGTVARVGLSIGTAGWVALETYRQLTTPRAEAGNMSYIERGAEQFGVGYGRGLPQSYYETQQKIMPSMKLLEAESEVAARESTADYYINESRRKIIADQKARYEANLLYPTFDIKPTTTTKKIQHIPTYL